MKKKKQNETIRILNFCAIGDKGERSYHEIPRDESLRRAQEEKGFRLLNGEISLRVSSFF